MVISINELITEPTPVVSSAAAVAHFEWQFSPPSDLRLNAGEVHVWLAQLNEENAAELERVISDDERARAERFRFELHKKQFVAARGALRIILGKYLKTSPRQLRFKYNKYGKPSIDGEFTSAIKFNLSHSDGLALYAFGRDREIGIDLERIRASFADEGLAAQCLTPLETARFRTLSGRERDLFFFDCWTRKEAFLKACGNGLSSPANKIETSFLSEFPTSFSETDSSSNAELGHLSLSFQKLPPVPGYAAALAVEGINPQLKCWRH